MALGKSISVARYASRVALISGSLYFVAVSALVVAVILNPDGGVTGDASWVMAFPWCLFMFRFFPSASAAATLIIVFGSRTTNVLLRANSAP